MLMMIDNYDSFTYNVVQYLSELGERVEVYRNDEISIEEIANKEPQRIVISPGPCTPNEAGVSLEVVRRFKGIIPILGVCLGHQSIGQVFGARIVKAKKVMHGKTSPIYHDGRGVFTGLTNPLTATRYHSLVVEPDLLDASMEVSAWTLDENDNVEEIMGIRHKTYLLEGVQFHPESIFSEFGHELLDNFLKAPIKRQQLEEGAAQ